MNLKYIEMKTKKELFILFLLTSMVTVQFFLSCDADVEVDKTVEEILSAQPSITSISPGTADILTRVTISGEYLNFADKAFVGDAECQITQRVNGETLEIEVAPNASTGVVKIITSAGMEAVSSEVLTVTYPTPNITSTFPSSATVNENIVIEGTNLESITKITFGEVEGMIQFQESQAIVVSVPNSDVSPVEVNYYYNSSSGEVSGQLSSSFTIVIPTPVISAWPSLMSRDNEVTLVGADMNLITGILVGGEVATLNTATATSVSFNVPAAVVTGYQDIVVQYGTSSQITQADVPYINGEYEQYFEYDSDNVGLITLSADTTAETITDVDQPPFPGTSFARVTMNTATGSTLARIRFQNSANDTWTTVLDSGSFSDAPVLHFWMKTDAEPIMRLYVGGSSSANRRQLSGSDTDTNGQWKLFAVRLTDFIPGTASIGGYFEFRFTTGSSAIVPMEMDVDWVIITDHVLTDLGAEDVTDLFGPAG